MADPIRHIPLSEVMPGVSSRVIPVQAAQPQKLNATQEEIIQELNRRRSALTPEQTVIVDELMRRMSPAQSQAPPQAPQLETRTPTVGEHAYEFAAGLASKFDPREFVKGIATVASNPLKAGIAMAEAQGELAQKAGESFRRGDYVTGARQAAHYMLPFVGPELESAAEKIVSGQYGRGAGEAVGAGLGFALPTTLSRLSRIRLTPRLQNLNPKEAAALNYVTGEGVPVPAGTLSGIGAIKAIQKGTAATPVGALVAAGSEAGQARGLTRLGTRLAEEAYPAQRYVPESAGASATKAFEQRVADFRNQAAREYGVWRAAEANPANTRSVPVRLDPQGNPVMADVPMPVDLRQIKAQFQPVYDEMNRAWSISKRETSPAYTAVENIVKGPDFERSSVVEQYLGSVKRLAREKEGRVGGMAKFIIPKMQNTIDASVAALDPAALQGLRAGRQIRATQAGTQEILDVLKGTAEEPVAAYRRIVQPGDAKIRFLRQVNREAPEQVAIAGRAYLEDLLKTATEEGGFKRFDKLWADWRNLGPETKKLLYKNPVLRENIDKFFLAAKKIGENPNPSGTATTLISMLTGGGGAWLAGPGATAGTILTAGAIAKLLYSPRGAKLLTQGLTLSGRGAAADAAWGKIMQIVGESDEEKIQKLLEAKGKTMLPYEYAAPVAPPVNARTQRYVERKADEYPPSAVRTVR